MRDVLEKTFQRDEVAYRPVLEAIGEYGKACSEDAGRIFNLCCAAVALVSPPKGKGKEYLEGWVQAQEKIAQGLLGVEKHIGGE